MRSSLKIVAGIAVAGLALAGCGSKPTDTPAGTASGTATAGGAKIKACIILDTGGVDDKSFNQSAWQGMQNAAKADPGITVSYLQSQGAADYEPNLSNSVKNGCKAIVSVGFNLADSTKKIAAANPTVPFAIVDNPSNGANVYGMTFQTAQSGFQAGYLAAALTKTGKVGTYGGLALPGAVTDYMDGYLDGVKYYNQQKSKSVQVLGWDGKTGTFAGSFTDQGKGRSITQQMFSQGADVIFPVAGGTGVGTLTEAESQNGKLTVFWVDFPGCTFYPQDCQFIATSVLKGIPEQIQGFLTSVQKGSPLTGTFDGTLKNNGTGIDKFNQFDSKIPADVKSELDAIKAKIISGEIKPETPGRSIKAN